jgi:hypothetical protein
MIRKPTLLALSLALAGALVVPALPAHAGWKVLGVVKADKGLDRDEIKVSSGRGFKQIKIKADGADVEIQKLHVIYGSGEPDELDVRKTLKEGATTFPLDLRGSERVIRKIVLWYKTPSSEGKKAIVTIYGND